MSQAATKLCRKEIQVVCHVVDNLTRPGFALIAYKAHPNGLPVFVFDSAQMKDGGAVCLSRDYLNAGFEAVEKAVNGQNTSVLVLSGGYFRTLLQELQPTRPSLKTL